MKHKKVVCPRCYNVYDYTFRALSRKDNQTDICDTCGTTEAMEDAGFVKWNGHIYWNAKVTP